jgi:hypothetical protein
MTVRRQQGRMNDVRVVGVKLQHIEEVPEHPGHFGSRRRDACVTPQLLKHAGCRFTAGFRHQRAYGSPQCLPRGSRAVSLCPQGPNKFYHFGLPTLSHASITKTVRYTVMSPVPFKDIWR